MAKAPPDGTPNAIENADMNQLDEDDEEYFQGLPEWRLPDGKWQELLSIVQGAGGNAVKMDKLRGTLEAIIGFFQHKSPEWSEASRIATKTLAAEWSQIFTAADALSKALENHKTNGGLLGKHSRLAIEYSEFRGKKGASFLTQLEIIKEFTSRLSNQKLKRVPRIDRDIFWEQLIFFWNGSLGLKITSSESSPLLKFIRSCSEIAALDRGFDALKPSDLETENIRSFIRKWISERPK